MSILLMKVLYASVDSPSELVNITDMFDMNVNRGLEIRNNVCIFSLKNSERYYNTDESVQYRYINSNKEIIFQEQDIIKLYIRYTDDMADVEDSDWDNTNTDEPSATYLKGVYYIIEHSGDTTINGNPIQIRAADKTYILFNKLLAKAFLESDNLNAPELIQKVVRFSSENQDGEYSGTGADAGVFYDIDAKLEDAESGYIQDTRKGTYEDGTVNSDTTFPDISISKVWKPVYEWINELSQIESINTSDELSQIGGKKIVYGRPFLYYVDEVNKFHWFETTDVVDIEIDIGTDTGIFSYDLNKKVFDSINFIIYRGGEDLYGKGTLNYFYDETSDVKSRKMRVVGMTDISRKLIQKEISNGNLVENTSGSFTFSGNRYNRNGTVTPHWSSTSVSSDDDYNDSLITEIYRLGSLRARSLAKGLSRARYQGGIEIKGAIHTPGELLQITNSGTGQKNELIRVQQVQDNITKSGWFTTLSIEQDQLAIIEGDVS